MFRGINLTVLYGQNTSGSHHIAARCLLRQFAGLRCLSEFVLCFGKLVQPRVGRALNREDLYKEFSVIWAIRGRAKEGQNLLVHATPQEGIGFKNSELPYPHRAGSSEALISTVRFFLTLLQVAVQKGLIGVFKSNLRAFLSTTGQPASCDQTQEKKG
jgi:hypothetical protein